MGLLAILAYWYSVRPVDLARGYSEDLCADILRQAIAESLQTFGRPTFQFKQFMAPFGASAPFMSWAIERDWLGAYFWMWNPDFPFLWAYFGLSLVLSYFGVSWVLQKMRLPAVAAWSIALLIVLFNVPRHYKIWHHVEHLTQHWVYWGFLLDAWVWQKFYRDRRWSWNLELWRGVGMLGMTWTAGYFWGPILLTWTLVRTFMFFQWRRRRREGVKTIIEGTVRGAIAPVLILAAMLSVTITWYLPLFREISGIGEVPQGWGWWVPFLMPWRPLWLYPLWDGIRALFPAITWQFSAVDSTETAFVVGWIFWVPFVLTVRMMRKKAGGPGLLAMWPFLTLLIIALNYALQPHEHITAKLFHDFFPFMRYFRVASRWGLFLPQILALCVVLAWPEVSQKFRAWIKGPRTRKTAYVLVSLFALTSMVEFTFLTVPVNMQPRIPTGLESMLTRISQEPGESVLSMPFCVAGGNGVCTDQQCPNYPYSTVGMCFREWHQKDVYGLYQARMMPNQCQVYDRTPFRGWFNAWRENRCLDESEWDQFCSYLKQESRHAAILVFPDIWTAAGMPVCEAKFAHRLGRPIDEQTFLLSPTRGGKGANPTRVRWYKPRCETASTLFATSTSSRPWE